MCKPATISFNPVKLLLVALLVSFVFGQAAVIHQVTVVAGLSTKAAPPADEMNAPGGSTQISPAGGFAAISPDRVQLRSMVAACSLETVGDADSTGHPMVSPFLLSTLDESRAPSLDRGGSAAFLEGQRWLALSPAKTTPPALPTVLSRTSRREPLWLLTRQLLI